MDFYNPKKAGVAGGWWRVVLKSFHYKIYKIFFLKNNYFLTKKLKTPATTRHPPPNGLWSYYYQYIHLLFTLIMVRR